MKDEGQTLWAVEEHFVLKVPPADGLSVSEEVLGALDERLAAHAAREAPDVEDESSLPHDQVGAADLVEAPGTLDAEDALVVIATVELAVAREAGYREWRQALDAGQTILVVVALSDPHHVAIGDPAATACAHTLLRLHRDARF